MDSSPGDLDQDQDQGQGQGQEINQDHCQLPDQG